jgi:hypothetical protein
LLSAVAVLTGLSACAGVPRSSAPETIESLPLGAPKPPAIRPAPGDSARDIVVNFLVANAIDPNQHTAARQFLTPAAANRWSDTTATILADETVGTYVPSHPQVVVTGRVVGTVDSNGIYSPSLQRTGSGGPRVRFVYRISKVHNQFRIDVPVKGLLLTADQFQEAYQRRALYFFDLSNRYLVPDTRWSALSGLPLAEWLVSELAAGPAPQLQSAVSGDSVPPQAGAQRRFIHGLSPMKVEITGASQLDGAARDRLAAQIGTTLNDAMPGQIFEITDGGTPVRIPAAGNEQFDQSTFQPDLGPVAPAPTVFYLKRGRVVDSQGRLLPGAINNGRAGYLTSVAVGRSSPIAQLNFAGVAGGRLVVGTESSGFYPTSLHGDLTRPAFAPGMDEVWVGDGGKLYRVLGADQVPTRQPRVYQVPIPHLGPGRHIVAVRLSPEGSRIALIVGTKGGNNQLYVGAVVRTAGDVQVDLPASPISPAGVSVDDIAWIEPLALIGIGDLAFNREPAIFNTNVDGSAWSNDSIGNLPSPDSIAVEPGAGVWVSAHNTVWYQSGGEQWTSPSASGETVGYAPTYLE